VAGLSSKREKDGSKGRSKERRQVMLAIRLGRIGRKAYPTYRIIVQDAHRHPSSGRVVAYVGSFNPHTKEVTLDKEKIEKYLSCGAQPTTRVVKLLQDAKIKLPKWVELPRTDMSKGIRNPDKLRKNQPKEEKVEETAEEVVAPEEAAAEEAVATDAPAEETPAEPAEAAESEEK
jgi:small subunit ribosomal protein S16